MTGEEIAYFVGALTMCYWSGLKIGKAIKLIRDLGSSA